MTDDLLCASCGKPISERHVYHARLGVRVHFNEACMSDVCGEDIRTHTVMISDPPATGGAS